jgi:hypothetical protein
VKPAAPSKAQKKARRRARKLAAKQSTRPAETLQQQVDRVIKETLTEMQAPKPVPETVTLNRDELNAQILSAFGDVRQTAFWGTGQAGPGTAGASRSAQPVGQDLTAMDMDTLRAFAADALQGDADARGFRSPIWQAGGLRSTARS